MMRRASIPFLLAIALGLSGCAAVVVGDNAAATASFARERLGADAPWLVSEQARAEARTRADALLTKPLTIEGAVDIALGYSPAFQAALAEDAAASSAATQTGRLSNPVFTFERLVRGSGDAAELDIGRKLGFSVLELAMLPARLPAIDRQQAQLRLTGASRALATATEARSAWVRAVAARQALGYFEQVKGATAASAELAQRMEKAGNFTRLQRAREQVFQADAAARLARAQQAARDTREALVRVLGLDETQARALNLPDRLPDLPAAPRDEGEVAQFAIDQRLDVRLARAQLDDTAARLGLTRVTSVVNGLTLSGVRNSATGQPRQTGYELELPLPLFDTGDAQRAEVRAQYLAALNRAAQAGVDAQSQVRQSHAGYRSAYDIARRYRDEIVPLRKTIADETLLNYNGMFISVFELLADAREQMASVIEAIDAQRDFWLADAALHASLLGAPVTAPAER